MRHSIVTLLAVLLSLLTSSYSYSDADIDKGKLELKNDRVKEAKAYFLNALRRNPDSTEVKIELAKIYRRDSRNYEIEEILVHQVLHDEPKNIEALHLQGQIYYRSGQWNQAGEVYEKILSLYPGDYSAYISLSVILRELGDVEGARQLSENMKKLYPSTAEE